MQIEGDNYYADDKRAPDFYWCRGDRGRICGVCHEDIGAADDGDQHGHFCKACRVISHAKCHTNAQFPWRGVCLDCGDGDD